MIALLKFEKRIRDTLKRDRRRARPRPAARSVALLLAPKVEDEQPVLVAALDRRALDGTGEAYRPLEAAVRDFELVVRDCLFTRLVAAAPGDAQRVALDPHLKLVGRDAREFKLDDPAVARAVHVRSRVPELLDAAHAARLRHHPQVAFD